MTILKVQSTIAYPAFGAQVPDKRGLTVFLSRYGCIRETERKEEKEILTFVGRVTALT